MEKNNALFCSMVPSTTLRHQSTPWWLSVAETTFDNESAEILNSILELI
jgi:hypothetical protein